MSFRVIPLLQVPTAPQPGAVDLVMPGPLRAPTGLLEDTLHRPLRDLRISVTDRCNFRCVYCMPKEVFGRDHAFLPHSALLSFEEIERLARLFVAHGVEKIRLTGGEPLLRKNIEFLIERLAKLSTPTGQPLDLTLTTNGSLLQRKARSLKDAGLNRVTVSLDALDETLFKRMNDMEVSVATVLEGIAAAQSVGLAPLKVNMVVKRGLNDQQILPMARYFKGTGIILRYIEYMDVGTSNGWNMAEVVSSAEVVARLSSELPLHALEANSAGETSQRWGYQDGGGEIGVISSVTRAFCGSCTRARLSTDGKLYLCLFAASGVDLRATLRGGASDAEISHFVAGTWQHRGDRYSEQRGRIPLLPGLFAESAALDQRVEMSYIGG